MSNVTYNEFIQNIINTRGQWNIPDNEYWEGHHIKPECLGGKGNPRKKHKNIIRLYAWEHYVAHKLLAEENPSNKKIVLAFSMMAFPKSPTQQRDELTAEEYEEARKIFSDGQKGNLNPMSKELGGERHWFNNGSIEIYQCSAPNESYIPGRLSLSEKKKKNISVGLRNCGSNKQKVRCITTGEIFNSIVDAAKFANCCGSLISMICAGKRKPVRGLDFEYVGKTRKLKTNWIIE